MLLQDYSYSIDFYQFIEKGQKNYQIITIN